MTQSLTRQAHIAFFYLAIVAVLGSWMRFYPVADLPGTYRYLVHTHSHIALLGWVYVALTTLLYGRYFQASANQKTYRKIFIFTQITLLGMLLSFPWQGYGLISILFSSLFLLATYAFTWFFIKNIPPTYKTTPAHTLIRWSLFYLVLSSCGTWALGGIMSTLGNTSIWYQQAIYFFLHFQYNGWMIPVLIGLLLSLFEKENCPVNKKEFNTFFIPFNLSIVFTFFLSSLYLQPHWSIYLLAGIGVVGQVFAFAKLFQIVLRRIPLIKPKIRLIEFRLLSIIGLVVLLKILLQTLSVIPYFAHLAYRIPEFIIGYLHGVFLGIVTPAIFLFVSYFLGIPISKKALTLYWFAFVFTELLIFYKALSVWLHGSWWQEYYLVLAVGSLLFPLSVFALWIRTKRL